MPSNLTSLSTNSYFLDLSIAAMFVQVITQVTETSLLPWIYFYKSFRETALSLFRVHNKSKWWSHDMAKEILLSLPYLNDDTKGKA